ncbi:MAG: NAD-dependent DNA ligase LigA [Clostridia bacterium]|nr:NAD-dependent DNA ligase LigA [Clostridia bacterium]
MTNEEKISRIKYLVDFLNKCADEYYNGFTPTLSDAQYDELFDELSALEKECGVILATSPTQRVGYEVLGELPKVTHKIPLLSLAKTKDPSDIVNMVKANEGYLALKIDGLTVELLFENGILTEASTRGDGTVGEIITHNAKVFKNIPRNIPYKGLLRVTGEAYIDIATFDAINEKIENDEEKYSTPRNLAAGSVRQLDSAVCKERNVCFMPFNVLEGLEDVVSRTAKIDKLKEFGFTRIPSINLSTDSDTKYITESIYSLKATAGKMGLPIDGIVFFYDDAVYSAGLGRTAHHFKDGIAFKFGDPHFETKLMEIEWSISRTGQLTPIAHFSAVEIDNTVVERASLHNMTFVKDLKLLPNDRIMVSKRNMIIPHVEKNLDAENRKEYILKYPLVCPVCSGNTTVSTTENNNRTVEVLYCKNTNCAGKNIKKFTHFVSKPALNIDGLSEQTIEKFIKHGWLLRLRDIFSLSDYEKEIVALEGFGQKSFDNLVAAIEAAKSTSLSNLLVAMNIDLIGKSAAKLIEDNFSGNVQEFLKAVEQNYDFTEIEGLGDIMNNNLYNWFSNQSNLEEFIAVCDYLTFKEIEASGDESSFFFGKKIVITGTLESFTRDELTDKLTKLGAKVSGSVSSKTDLLICGENAGSKLTKAKSLSVPVLSEEEVLKLL